MTTVSLVIPDLPLITSRGRTVPQLGLPDLSQRWAASNRAVYTAEQPFGLIEAAISWPAVTEAITASSPYSPTDTTAQVHLCATAAELDEHPELLSWLGQRLPNQLIIPHLITPTLPSNTPRYLANLVEQAGLQPNDLVLTTQAELREHYPAAQVIAVPEGDYKGILITNHTPSQKIINVPADQLIMIDQTRLPSLVRDELQSGAHEQLTVLADVSSVIEADSWIQQVIEGLTTEAEKVLFIGLPGDRAVGRWYPIAFLSNPHSRSHLLSAVERYGPADARALWQQHHALRANVPVLARWMHQSL